jgi:hypothetical protein
MPSLGCTGCTAREEGLAAVAKNDTVIAAVAQVAEGFRERVYQQYFAHYHAVVGDWLKLSAEKGMTSPHNLYPTEGNMGHFAYQIARHKQIEISYFLANEYRRADEWMNLPGLTPFQRSSEQLKYSLRPDYEASIKLRAEKLAKEAIEGFVTKMTRKLFGILDAKGDFKAVEVRGTLGQNSLFFAFEDGSCFTLINDIVILRSSLGKVFNQYPTRFTNVTWHGSVEINGGKNMKGLSEAWMKKNFK